ncbi:uroporphyrinogen decarboxylase/cobalamine-independent methonine synthase family protein [Rhizomonospora bruguierae]|uniref:hypothetical protein n=1 Tax=Rhizomonospora bruguierae TaxID=1581705 RepID=UPI001BCFC675|nr:hypothetical protein [Micromonospora sp. NBRC 107566]
MTTPALLPTTVIGSYSVPDWLERARTDYHRGRISSVQLGSIHDVCVKAALKDQELAGIDIVSDGELRRDNDIDYVLARLPGVRIAPTTKDSAYDYFDAYVDAALPEDDPPELGLARDYAFASAHTDRPAKFSFTGPFSLSRRIHNHGYRQPADLVRAIARLLNAEMHALAAAGATILQIDEPFLAGYPDEAALAVEAVNIVTAGVNAQWSLHVCYGNRYARPSWEGHYDFLFPAVHKAEVDVLALEFARKGYDDLDLVTRAGWDRTIGLGVIDVKNTRVEPVDLIVARLRRALRLLPPERIQVNPDCGLRHLPTPIATAKLQVMVHATRLVRDEIDAHARGTDSGAANQEDRSE